MPKRQNDTSLEFIAKKLKKLEKEVKRSRKSRSNCIPTSSSSSASSRSSSSSSCSSRSNSPINLENLQNQEETTNVDVHCDATEIPPTQNMEVPTIILSENNIEETPIPSTLDDADADIIEILGADPSVSEDYGSDINKEVATRFTHIATSGLDKDIRKDLIKKHLIPANCKEIGAPQLNVEIKAALTEQVVKRDKAIEARQKQMAAGISFLGKIISDQLAATHKNNDLIKDLMDVGRMFCDIQHSESEARRQFALYTVKKELKDQLSTTKIDKFLFGSNFSETLKTAKAVSKSSSDLKPYENKKSKKATPSSKNQNLNWKARTAARRQPQAHPPMYQPPMYQPPVAQPAAPRGNSSRNYTPRHKQTRRQ